MKDRMNEIGIKMTELSQYMKISRPSLYKYLDSYESKEYEVIPDKILRSFKELDRRKRMTKEQFIAFVLNEFDEAEPSNKKEIIRKYVSKCGQSDFKLDLIYRIIDQTQFDDLVPYFANCLRILSEGPKDESEYSQIARFVQLKENVTKNVPVSQGEIESVKKLLEE